MKQIISIVALLTLGFVLWTLVPIAMPSGLGPVTRHYVADGLVDNGGSNLVTSIVVNYRGFDTLGEVTVLFLSVSGAAFVLRRRTGIEILEPELASEIVQTGARLLFAPIVVFGAYIFVHGHLTPGGGFQGGAVVASGVLLLLLADRDRHLPHGLLAWVESLSGFGFVLAGAAGLLAAGSFLANRGVLPLGQWNRLASAGIIPVIYILIGLKVGSELSVLLDLMIRRRRQGGGHR
jgi:Multisubunit Na+/H+ antiporter, MnhB subunit